MLRIKTTELIKKAALGIEEAEVSVPENENFGHYSTNIAFKLSKERKMSPVETAQKLKEKILAADSSHFFKQIDVVNPGFINFWISDEALNDELKDIFKQKSNYGKSYEVQPRKMARKANIEFVSANPTGPLTMANARGGFLGDALANVLEFAGCKVTREYYINDAGNQIKILGASVLASQKKIPHEKNHYQGEYVKELAKKLKLKIAKIKKGEIKSAIEKIGRFAAAELLREIKKSLNGAGIKFDVWRSEANDIRGKGLVVKLFKKLKDKNLIAEHDGAEWLKAGLVQEEERVIKKSDGDYTYYPVDLAYHLEKFKNYDKAIDVWGADHHGNVAPMKKGLEIFGVSQDRLHIILMQMVRLVREGKEVKISKRAGNFVLLDDLLKEVGRDAARFFFIMHSPETHMDFDLGLAKERSIKNPVYYTQYAYVRAWSILRKSQSAKSKVQVRMGSPMTQIFKDASSRSSDYQKLGSSAAQQLVLQLVRFPEVIQDTASDYQIARLTRYAIEVARAFHNFYEKERIIGEKDKNLAATRLRLVLATQIVLGSVLDLLGVSKPKKM